jgi:endonuclease/exonuclease/phosphatase family metal-dependent hydrolase
LKLFIYKTAIFFNLVVAFLLIVSYISVYISPDFIPILAFFGLIYPVLLFLNFVFSVFWIFRKNKLFLISVIAIFIGINNFLNFFAFGSNAEIAGNNKIKILSYNVRMFNLYDWNDDKESGNKIFQYIKNENPDIICLQEFYSDKKNHNFQDSIIKFQRTKDYLISFKNKENYSGNAIFSRFPIVNSGFVNIGTTKQKCIFADIKIEKDTIRVYSIHLASIHLDRKDYEYIDNIDENQESDIFFGIGSKVSKAYQTRSREVEAISPHVLQSTYKSVVCGDFNDIPISYSYKKIRGKFKDSFLESGFATGGTYNGLLPSFRIDYILHNPKLQSNNFKVGKIKSSDHFPISCDIYLE